MYKKRFENLSRVAKKITSSLNIGDILESIRDEAKATIPYAAEACLLIMDPDAAVEGDILVGPTTADRIRGRQLFKNVKKEVTVFSLVRAL